MTTQAKEPRRYYSARKQQQSISPVTAHWRLKNLYALYRDRDYFKEKLECTRNIEPPSLTRVAAVRLGFQAFPLKDWSYADTTNEMIFDVVEFLWDHASKPGELALLTTETGYTYHDYGGYDEMAGKEDFRMDANLILMCMGEGFELTNDGHIRAIGSAGLAHIFNAEIVSFDEENVDSKIRSAIAKWRDRHATLVQKKEAIRELADVFEWLKKTQKLSVALVSKDESALFDIANNFAIRHHSPSQKNNYDQSVWYNWMFHFYLATYHAVIRLLLKQRNAAAKASEVIA